MDVAAAIYSALEAANTEQPRAHLGASVIGGPCLRAIWYGFRWYSEDRPNGRILRLFRRGHREEIDVVRDLRLAGFKVEGQQEKFSRLGGHFGGSVDGYIWLKDTRGVLEIKTHNLRSFTHLQRHGVRDSKPQHYAQCQMYMHWSGCPCALYVAVCKDNDRIYVEVVPYQREMAENYEHLALRIIETKTPPRKVSERPDWWQCKFCQYRQVCHQNAVPQQNCRTCHYSRPDEGEWRCDYHDESLSLEKQSQGCEDYGNQAAAVPTGIDPGSPPVF